MKWTLSTIGCALSIATAVAGASCSTSTTCAVDSNGNSVCASYTSAYPYDYVYYDPVYATTWGYYPYYVDSYYDPYGYTYVYALPAPVPVADAATTGSNAPELLDKAHRSANAVDVAVRAALDPIKTLIKTPPQQNSDNIVYGPGNVGNATYQFTLRRLSQMNHFAWKLEAGPVSSTASLSLVAGGTIAVGSMPRRGRGVFGVDCTAMSAADSSVTCRGQLLMGFAHTDGGDKILNVGLKGYTPDLTVDQPMDAKVFDWRHGDSANHVRLVTKTNLSASSSSAPETVTIKLTWIKDVGVRADAVATDGDIAPGQQLRVSTCVPANLDPSQATTSTQTCHSDGTGCTTLAGSMTVNCGSGLETPDVPNPDPAAPDAPTGMPEMPTEPTAMPDGTGN